MSYEDDVKICVTLRNFESDSDYLDFKDFRIEKLSEDNKKQLCIDLKYFTNYPYDNHIAVRHIILAEARPVLSYAITSIFISILYLDQ